ncbi:MAG: hypothetical protein KAV99_00795 [Candidatus Latescibacteria bacterium]|nr:hypothetical protein [Candidatus Latescibacterota bacterium]
MDNKESSDAIEAYRRDVRSGLDHDNLVKRIKRKLLEDGYEVFDPDPKKSRLIDRFEAQDREYVKWLFTKEKGTCKEYQTPDLVAFKEGKTFFIEAKTKHEPFVKQLNNYRAVAEEIILWLPIRAEKIRLYGLSELEEKMDIGGPREYSTKDVQRILKKVPDQKEKRGEEELWTYEYGGPEGYKFQVILRFKDGILRGKEESDPHYV